MGNLPQHPHHCACCVPGSALRLPRPPFTHPANHSSMDTAFILETRKEGPGQEQRSRSHDLENAHSGWSGIQGRLTEPPSEILPRDGPLILKPRGLRHQVVTAREPGNEVKKPSAGVVGMWGKSACEPTPASPGGLCFKQGHPGQPLTAEPPKPAGALGEDVGGR